VPKLRRTTTIVLAASLATVLVASPTYARVSPEQAPLPVSDPTADGIELFSAIWFGTGHSAEQVAAASGDPPLIHFVDTVGAQPQQKAAARGLAAELEAADPTYFAELSSDLRSGDVYTVEAAISAATDDVLALVGPERPAANTPDAVVVGAVVAAVVVLVVWSAAAAVNVAGAVNVGGAVNVAGWFNLKTSVNVTKSVGPNSGSRLQAEETVADLTASLES